MGTKGSQHSIYRNLLGWQASYGDDLGRDFIHVHHLKPVGEVGEAYVLDPVRDLRPVCPNCHAMLHQRLPALKIEQLKEIIHQQRVRNKR